MLKVCQICGKPGCRYTICDYCEKFYATCIECGKLKHIKELDKYIYDHICPSCYGIRYRECPECGFLSDSFCKGVCRHCRRHNLGYRTRKMGKNIEGTTFERIKTSRWYGVEIETDDGIYERIPKPWGIKFDDSIDGLELVSPLMRGDEGLESIREVYECGLKFKKNCGIHVHVDVRDLSCEQLIVLVKAFEDSKKSWLEQVAPHRLENEHCNGCNVYPEDRWETWFLKNCEDRYKWVNFRSVKEQGSVELRILEGCDVEKCVNWVSQVVNWVDENSKEKISA